VQAACVTAHRYDATVQSERTKTIMMTIIIVIIIIIITIMSLIKPKFTQTAYALCHVSVSNRNAFSLFLKVPNNDSFVLEHHLD